MLLSSCKILNFWHNVQKDVFPDSVWKMAEKTITTENLDADIDRLKKVINISNRVIRQLTNTKNTFCSMHDPRKLWAAMSADVV